MTDRGLREIVAAQTRLSDIDLVLDGVAEPVTGLYSTRSPSRNESPLSNCSLVAVEST